VAPSFAGDVACASSCFFSAVSFSFAAPVAPFSFSATASESAFQSARVACSCGSFAMAIAFVLFDWRRLPYVSCGTGTVKSRNER
jgi:hypothetical protein